MSTKPKKTKMRVSFNSKLKKPPRDSQSIEELAAIIRFDPRTIFEADGRTKRPQDLSPDERLAIADIEIDPVSGRILRAEFKNKIDAAEESLRRAGKGDDPATVELIKAARLNQQRTAEVVKAMEAMLASDKPGTVN